MPSLEKLQATEAKPSSRKLPMRRRTARATASRSAGAATLAVATAQRRLERPWVLKLSTRRAEASAMAMRSTRFAGRSMATAA